MPLTEAETLIRAADLLRLQSRSFYDVYQRDKYSHSSTERERAQKAFIVYSHYNRLATDIDVIALAKKER